VHPVASYCTEILPFYASTGIVSLATRVAKMSLLPSPFPSIPIPLTRSKNSRNKRTDIEEVRHYRRYTAFSRHVPMGIKAGQKERTLLQCRGTLHFTGAVRKSPSSEGKTNQSLKERVLIRL
jgi:hypothetical protein